MDKPVLSLLRVKRMARQISMREASSELQLNQTDYGRVERLQLQPSRRVAQALTEKYGMPLDKLLAPLRP